MRAALLLLGACSSPSVLEARKLPANVSADAQAVVDANNAFACDLYAQLAPTRANIFFSPFSISTALAMLDAGAAGTTDTQLRAAMHEDLPTDAMNAAYRAILASLDTGTSYGGYSLQIADRLFGQQGFPFLPSYLATTKDDYSAPLEPVDFSDPTSAASTIDQWVSNRTDGAIPELLAPSVLDPSTRLVIANAIHFEGKWVTPFDPATNGVFTTANGPVSAPMMSNSEDRDVLVGYVPSDHVQVGALPFQGTDIAMIIVLPDTADGLPAVEAELTPAHLASWLAAPQVPVYGETNLILPKYSLDDAIDLKQVLVALGVIDAFGSADFSGIDGQQDLVLDGVQHEAVLRVDEQGAEASAATAAPVKITIGPPPFHVNHPFIFMIYDEVTGAVLFMGRVNDPTQN